MAFDQSATAGDTLVAGSIHSPNYATGSSGWSINRDGSAEFQNVLVRGTITGSTIIGSTIVGGDFRSTNYVAGVSGFDLNSTTNQIEINTGFRIGGASPAQHISIGLVGGTAQFDFVSGLAGETNPGLIAQNTFVQPGSGSTAPFVEVQSSVINNGGTIFAVKPPDTQDIGVIQMQTVGTTSPAGNNSVTGALVLGTLAGGTDVWQLYISNENSVIVAGPTLGNPGLRIGNNAQSRLFVSTNELLTVDGTNATETLYLNTNNAQSVAGGVVNPWMRQQSTAYTGAAITPGLAYTSSGIGISGLRCPASATATAWLRFQVISNTTIVAADFLAGAIQIDNTTQVTTPFAASDNRCAAVNGPFVSGTTSNGFTLYTQVCATALGNPGDLLTLTAQFRQNSLAAGHFFQVFRVEIGWIPSL